MFFNHFVFVDHILDYICHHISTYFCFCVNALSYVMSNVSCKVYNIIFRSVIIHPIFRSVIIHPMFFGATVYASVNIIINNYY